MLKIFSSFLLLFFLSSNISSQTSMGEIIPNTNPGLPNSYNFQEYVFPEPDDEGVCNGSANETSALAGIFIAQTHRLNVDHPFFFTIGHRPALLQVALTGEGASPDVSVEGFLEGSSLGKKCLAGPDNLSAEVDLTIPNFENYFSVTLPKSWVIKGLELIITVDQIQRTLTSEELNTSIYTEMNLVLFEQDVLDYNTTPHRTPIIESFLEETASAIPASVVRVGVFPEMIVYPEIAVTDGTNEFATLKTKGEFSRKGIPDLGNLNAMALSSLANIQQATGDFLSTVYYGNTLNLDPGGWGGGSSFVSHDYNDVYIHELGHALGLPHWGDDYNRQNPNEFEYSYPYAGESGVGSGRGHSWNFIQNTYEFIDPMCIANEDRLGVERSDAMQRNDVCYEQRADGIGPWDGFGDFSSYSMVRYLIGGEPLSGVINYKGMEVSYQFRVATGFPQMKVDNGTRSYERHPSQPTQFLQRDEFSFVRGEEKLNQDVYLIYGSAHENQPQANFVYKPIKYNGTLPPFLDPTNSDDIAAMKSDRIYLDHLGSPRDITYRITYEDGSVLHILNDNHSYLRVENNQDFGAFRGDICYWAMVVPGDKEIVHVELFNRPLVARAPDDKIAGNVNDADQNITAENFMDGAIFQAEYKEGQAKTLGSISLGNKVWNDMNRNGIEDFGEPGIPGVKILLWGDSDDDDIPDSEGFMGGTETDENGEYAFEGLAPGKYLTFVWFVDNYDEGGPLHNMVPTAIFEDPNTDINLDNNGRSGAGVFPGLGAQDIASGIVDLTEDGEPLNDGNREDDWFDLDSPGNFTVDFGFHNQEPCPKVDALLEGEELLCPGESTSIKITEVVATGTSTYIWSQGSEIESITVDQPGTYSVSVTDGNGCTGIASFTVAEDNEGNCTTSIAEIENHKINVFPNPVNNELRIEIEEGHGHVIQLYNLSGLLIRHERMTSSLRHHMLLDKVQAGMYLLIIKDSNKEVIGYRKIVKLTR